MKRFVIIICLSLAIIGILIAETTSDSVTVNVIECQVGNWELKPEELKVANTYLTQGNIDMYSKFLSIAQKNGHYTYNIIVQINGELYVIVRDEPYDVGQKIIVSKSELK